MLKFKQIKVELAQAIKNGVYTHKLPSIRIHAAQRSVSVSTIQKAYLELELEGVIVSRPQKGFFVKKNEPLKGHFYGSTANRVGSAQMLEQQVLYSLNGEQVLPLSSTAPSSVINNEALLNKHHKKALYKAPYKFCFEDEVQGSFELRQAISQYIFKQGWCIEPNQLHITSGRREGLMVSLLATKSIGQTVAIESPSSFFFQASVKQFCSDVVEIPMQQDFHREIALLDEAWQTHRFNVYITNPNFNDPTGRVLTNSEKESLLKWAEKRDVALIEYDRGELYFGQSRPASLAYLAKANSKVKVLSIQDFFDTVSSRMNLGFVIGINTNEAILHAKHTTTEEPNLHAQNLICSFITSGDYRKALMRLRAQLHRNCLEALKIMRLTLPQDVVYTIPTGGPCVWLELNDEDSSIDLWHKLVVQNIAIAPGTMFSFSDGFASFFRFTYALPWNARLASGIKTICQAI